MATPDDYLNLRRMTGEVEDSTYTNTDLDLYIERTGSLEGAAAAIWAEKASDYADMVNMSEAGNQRSLSDLYKHASDQRDYFNGLAVAASALVTGSSTTRAITRA